MSGYVPKKSTRSILGTKHPSHKHLLEEDTTFYPPSTTGCSLEDFVVEVDEYVYPTEDQVPAGYYFSEIMQVDCRLKNDKALLDVCYEIESMPTGNIYYIKQTYPKDSQPIKDLYKALVAAGVKPGSCAGDFVGVQERIHLDYVSTTSNFGSIIKRIPEPTPAAESDVSDVDAEDSEEYFEGVD